MQRLRGTPRGGGIALGSVSILRPPAGIPLLPPEMAERMARFSEDSAFEPIDVVLLSRDYESAAGLALPWARVVGIASQLEPFGPVVAAAPVVTGVEDLLASAQDGVLVLIDGERGQVLLDPDSMTLAAYQAERERLAPRRRFHLGREHEPAAMLDGRLVRVMARAATIQEASAGVESGADGIYVPEGAPLLPPDASDEAQLRSLNALAEVAAGKPLTVAGDAASISAEALLRAAVRADLILAAPLAAGAEAFHELQRYLADTREQLQAQELACADIRLAGLGFLGEEIEEAPGDYGVGRLVVETAEGPSLEATEGQDWLEDLARSAAELLIPVEVAVPASGNGLLAALALGASGLIVAPGEVQAVKEQVRALDTAACRRGIGRV